MCDRLSDVHGYICWECHEELIASGTLDISGFMGSPQVPSEKLGREFYDRLFPIMHGSPLHPDTPLG
jgi:hypothetical protein